MRLYDLATSRDFLDCRRLLEGKVRGTPRTLSPGFIEECLVAEMSLRVWTGHAPEAVDEPDDTDSVLELLTLDETADRLGLSVKTVQRAITAGELVSVHIGKAHRVRPADLARYIAALPSGTSSAAAPQPPTATCATPSTASRSRHDATSSEGMHRGRGELESGAA